MIKLDLAIQAFKNARSLEFACEMLSKSYTYHGFDKLLYPENISTIVKSLSTSISEGELLDRSVNWHKLISTRHGERSQFIHSYRNYKSSQKPLEEIRILSPLVIGKSILDFGSGEGFLMNQLTKMGFDVTGQEIFAYEGESEIRYEKNADNIYKSGNLNIETFDTTLIKSTMHHIQSEAQAETLKRLASNTNQRIILWEEIWGVDDSNEYSCLKGTNHSDSLVEYMKLDHRSQYDFLIIVDFVGNVLIGDFKHMDLPFSFGQKNYWVDKLDELGFRLTNVLPLGFVEYMVHRSCHLIMVFDKK